jgi:predicted DNA-binding transcriptional regulator AlpA
MSLVAPFGFPGRRGHPLPCEDFAMADIIKDTRYLRTKEAAHYVGLSARTLEKHRTYGTGPAYRKIGGRVVYSIEDLRAWVDRGQCNSTSDPNNGTVPPANPRPGGPRRGPKSGD